MRTTQRDKRTIWYALYESDTELMDSEGNYTGEHGDGYSAPVKARMNVSGGKGKAEIELFGTDTPFTRTAVTDDLTTPFDTETVFWFGIEPVGDGVVYEHNYRCTGVARTVNQVVLALAEVSRAAYPLQSI